MFLVMGRQVLEDVMISLADATPEDLARLLDGEPIVVRTASIRGDKVKLAFKAPKSVGVDRREVADARRREALAAAK